MMGNIVMNAIECVEKVSSRCQKEMLVIIYYLICLLQENFVFDSLPDMGTEILQLKSIIMLVRDGFLF